MAGDVVPSVRRDRGEVDEGPSPDDLERFGGVTQTCPECGTELFDDVAICWNCGHALTGARSSAHGRLWTAAIALLVVIAFILVWVL